MIATISIYELIGIPDAFIVILLTLGLIATIAPLVPVGTDFGLFKIPYLPRINKLRIIGPISFIILLLLALPVWSLESNLKVVSSSFGGEKSPHSIVIKILNTGESTVYIHTAKISVEGIYAFIPSSIQLCHIQLSHKYDVPLPIKDFPYEIQLGLSQAVKSQEADKFEICIIQDYSFFYSLMAKYDSILTKHSNVKKFPNGKKIREIPVGAEDAAFREFKANLCDEDKSLLEKLGIASMHTNCYDWCDIVIHFRLYLVDSNKAVLKAGEYLYMSKQNPGTMYELTGHNKDLYNKLTAIEAVRNHMVDSFFEQIRPNLKN